MRIWPGTLKEVSRHDPNIHDEGNKAAMKFKIRFADQIVGFFIVLSLASLIFVIVMLGRSQRWFSKDISFSTILPSAGGLSKNMAVQFRGFTIGNVKTFHLTGNDDVEVIFSIHEEYRDRVKQGSMVEMMVSPVGLGNQFQFHAGRGEALDEGAFVPAVGTAQARELVRQGLAIEPQRDDSISVIMNRVGSVLDDLGRILAQVNEAFGPGTDVTDIGKIVGSIQKTLAGAESLPQTVDHTVITLNKMIEEVQAEIKPILSDIGALTAELNDPDNLIYTVLDTDNEVYTSLVKSLASVSGILDNLDRTTAFIPNQLPQVAGLITDLRVTLRTAEDVLVALTNNPLLRKGIPEKAETQSHPNPRDIRF
jgi:phospholipid/cholesterol/gamma-HCH transport system substrate-binding protein